MPPPNKEQLTLQIRGYSLAELAKIYNVCDRTFKKWIKPFAAEIGARQGRYFTINQVKTIFDKLGLPGEITIKQNNVGQQLEKSGKTRHKSA